MSGLCEGETLWAVWVEQSLDSDGADLLLGLFETEQDAHTAMATIANGQPEGDSTSIEVYPYVVGESSWTEGYVTEPGDDR